jgi:hypothetical protein
MENLLRAEVDQNYDFFQRNLSGLLENHAGRYALIKSRKIVGFYDGPGIAYRAGLALFADEIFSVQEVTDEPVDLGFWSLGVA